MLLRLPAMVVLALMLALAIATPFARDARAQEGTVDVVSDVARNDFPAGVTFTLTFNAASAPDEVRLRYELAPDGTGATAVAQCDGTGTINCSYTLTSGRGIFIIPGAEITYHWEVAAADGERATTTEQLYVHEDTRFSFSQISEGNVTVYYHPGVADRAPAVLQAAVEALDRAGRLEATTVPFPVKVFLYQTAQEMQPAIISTGVGEGVVILGEVVYSDTAMVSADSDTLDITRHEIAHIVTREATSGPYDMPGWLNEGISVFMQNQPLPGHAAALEAAIRANRPLLPLELNSSSSGGSAATVSLYYGQAGSMVAYLVETYGEAQFAELVRTFKEGSRIDAAFESVYGFDQLGLENEWRAWVGLPQRIVATPAPETGEDPIAEATATSGDDNGASSAGDSGDDGGTNIIAYAIIGVLAVLTLGTVAYSASVIRTRL